ncbi:MAG: L,D-transpeptidase [Sphingomonadales bacterium]
MPFFAALVLGLAVAAGVSKANAEERRFIDPTTQTVIIYQSDENGLIVPQAGGGSRIPREDIAYDGPYGPNTIIVSTPERRLYYVYAPGRAIRYGVGVGREGFQWSGTNRITRKAEWPGWTPPAQMRARQPGLPAYMPGGLDNPLGARAMYIGATLYRIHGSNAPSTIGHAVSSGCIRMTNEDVIDLYERVSVGTKVVVLQ